MVLKQYQILIKKIFIMIDAGIDVAKNKHNYFITNSDVEVLFNYFTISNNREDFESLFQRITSISNDLIKVEEGLETTRHYCYNPFPELEKLVTTLYIVFIYALLSELPSAYDIAVQHLTSLTILLSNSCKDKYGKNT